MPAGEKKRFVLRIDAEKLKILEKWAADDFRSINGQIEFLLDKAIKENKRNINPNKRGRNE
ncbi:MAG: Arc family DNA binding domain-containing protein [Chitinophagales bacterium]